MPSNVDSFRVNRDAGPEKDRRRKLTEEDRVCIRRLHASGISIRELTRRYGVDRRLIQFTLFPERAERNRAHRRSRGGSKQYYDREQWRETMREHREYKRRLMESQEG